MANIKSAKKRIKVTIRNTERNKAVKSNIKTLRKNADLAIAGKAENKESLIKMFMSGIDSAVSKGVFHKNKASRLKSRMAAKLKKA